MDEPMLPTVLVVDDDQPTLQLMARFLSLLEVSPVLASNADEALDMLQDAGQDIRLIFLDLTMPHVDGFELVTRIRKIAAFQTLPLVVLTGRRDMEAQRTAYAAGADEVIGKPFDPNILKHTLMKYGVIPLA